MMASSTVITFLSVVGLTIAQSPHVVEYVPPGAKNASTSAQVIPPAVEGEGAVVASNGTSRAEKRKDL